MRLRLLLAVVAFPLAMAAQACGSSDSNPGPDAGLDAAHSDAAVDAPSFDGSTPETSADASPDVAEAGEAGALLAPLIDAIGGIDGGVHIGWTNNTPNCDAVLGERKDGLHPYAEVINVSGTTTKYDDLTATMTNANYTYRLRCMKGGAYSPYSNEQSGMPH